MNQYIDATYRAAKLINSIVGPTEGADIALDQVRRDGDVLIVGDDERDGSLTVEADDTVRVWVQGQVAKTGRIEGAYREFAEHL